MEYNVAIVDFSGGMEVEGFYVLSAAAVKRAANGKPFLAATLSDATGSIDTKVWDYTGTIHDEDIGKVIKIRGEVGEFKGSLQLTVNRIRFANEQDKYNVSDLVATAPIDAVSMLEEVQYLISTMDDADYRSIAETMLERHIEAFRTIPAAKSVHHGFLQGLLMHTGNMMRLADFLAEQYVEVIDRNLLLCGTLLHDFSKEKEFTFSNLGLVTDYSIPGDLLGHLVMGAMEVRDVAKELGTPEEKSMLLQHLILSHHGEPDHGAAIVPKCAEAELLSLIDQIDSRMEIYAEAFETTPTGKFTPRIFALEKKIYNHN